MEAQLKRAAGRPGRGRRSSSSSSRRAKVEVKLRIDEQQALLDSAQKDLRELLDAEAAKRSDQQGVLLQQVLSGANKNGIVADAG